MLGRIHAAAIANLQQEIWDEFLQGIEHEGDIASTAWHSAHLLLLGTLAERQLLAPSVQRQIQSRAFPRALEDPGMATCGVYLAVRMKHASQLLVESLAYIQDVAFNGCSVSKAAHFVEMIGRIVMQHAQVTRNRVAPSALDSTVQADSTVSRILDTAATREDREVHRRGWRAGFVW